MGTDHTDDIKKGPQSESDPAKTLDQSEIDSLFQEFIPDADPEEGEDLAPSQSAPEPPPEEGLDQDTLNQIFAELGYEEVAVEVESPLPPDSKTPDNGIPAASPSSAETPALEPPPAEPLPRPDPASSPPSQSSAAAGRAASREEELPTLLETPAVRRGSSRWIWIAGMLLIGLAGAGSWLYVTLSPGTPPPAETPALERAAIPTTEPEPLPAPSVSPPPSVAPTPRREPGSAAQILETHLAAVTQLGSRLRTKRDEIEALRERYERQNLELARTIREKVRKLNIASLPEALGDDQIKLDLQTIQRRQAYGLQLNTPLAWVERGLAELAYIRSRFSVDLELGEVIRNYDLEGHIALSRDVLARNEPTAERLAMAVNATQYQSLETIWDEIVYIGEQAGFDRTNPNFAIWQEICDGAYGRAAQLTQLSPRAAQCLSQQQTSDLFLNQIQTLSAEAAHHLSRWPGRWLCLNGLEALDVAAGRALLEWRGERISLNRLKALPPEMALHLPRWPGRHLELMGLEHPAGKAQTELYPYLHQWQQQRGGTPYLPPEMETQYMAYAAELAPKAKKYGYGFYFEPEKESP